MEITRRIVADQLIRYLHHEMTLDKLVNWAEAAMMESDFEDQDFGLLRDIVSRIGLADVREFGMTWDDCEGFLSRLGYRIEVTISEAA